MNTADICAERSERMRAGHPHDPAWRELIEQRNSAIRSWKECGLPTRLARALANGGVWSLAELADMPRVELLDLEDIGLGALSTIDTLLGRETPPRGNALPTLVKGQQATVDRWNARVGAERVATIVAALADMVGGDQRERVLSAIAGLLRIEAERRRVCGSAGSPA